MNIFELITQEELDEAPEDPSLAFTQLVGHAQRRLADFTRSIGDDNQGYALDEARHGFMNVTIGLAKAYGVQPFASMDMPKFKNFGYEDHNQFKADLDHYMTQLMVASSIKAKSDSVEIAPKIKDKIRSYIHALKTSIDKSDFSESKRENLHSKLRDFEAELEKKRVSFLAVTKFAFVILAVPGSLWASYEVVTKLTNNILQAVGEAKAVEDEERRLPDHRPMPVLIPPRKDEEETTKAGDLDDEIPF